MPHDSSGDPAPIQQGTQQIMPRLTTWLYLLPTHVPLTGSDEVYRGVIRESRTDGRSLDPSMKSV